MHARGRNLYIEDDRMTSHSLLKAQLRTVHVRTALRPVLESSHEVGKNDHVRRPNTTIVGNN
jgi:hypothetical protein